MPRVCRFGKLTRALAPCSDDAWVPPRHPLRLLLIATAVAAAILAATASAAPVRATTAPFTYVALGDSFSSGEGVRPFLASGAACDRSSRAYSTWVRPPGYARPLYAIASGAGAAGRGGANTYGSGASSRKAGGVTWIFRACSGATTQDVLAASNSATVQKANLVTLTVGGNDVGYVEAHFSNELRDHWRPLDHLRTGQRNSLMTN